MPVTRGVAAQAISGPCICITTITVGTTPRMLAMNLQVGRSSDNLIIRYQWAGGVFCVPK